MTALELIASLADAIIAEGNLKIECRNRAGDFDFVGGVSVVDGRFEVTEDINDADY